MLHVVIVTVIGIVLGLAIGLIVKFFGVKPNVLAERLERRGMETKQAEEAAGRLGFLLWSAVTAPEGSQSAIVQQMTAALLQELFPTT